MISTANGFHLSSKLPAINIYRRHGGDITRNLPQIPSFLCAFIFMGF